MAQLYPETQPFDEGLLDVADGNRIAWEVSGNPDGNPAVVLHGGPGSGRSAWTRRYFDPAAYKIILFDQRGCGLSTPHAGDPETDLSVNTTSRLLDDMERLRRHLGVERWLVFGHSWGTTLGLAYAERHPELVSALVLVGVTMTRQSEIDWLYRYVAPLYPAEWQRFKAGAPAGTDDGDLVEAYARLLEDPDPAVRDKAAKDWHDWEAASLSADPDAEPPRLWSDPRFRFARARIVTHYFRHRAWLRDDQLLDEAHKLRGIPGVMVQGRLDLEAPLVTAWELARAWPKGELVIVPHAGHSDGDAGMAEAITGATDRLAS